MHVTILFVKLLTWHFDDMARNEVARDDVARDDMTRGDVAWDDMAFKIISKLVLINARNNFM